MKIKDKHAHKKTFFQNGMTLNEYLLNMETNFEQNNVANKIEEDLYETCGNNKLAKSKLMTFQIRESDEDEYEEQNQQNCKNKAGMHPLKLTSDQQKIFLKNTVLNLPELGKKGCTLNIRQLQIKKQSKSPFTDRKNVKSVNQSYQNFALTFFAEVKKSKNSKRTISPLSTLTGKFPQSRDQKTKPHQEGTKKHLRIKYIEKINLIKKQEKQLLQKQKLKIEVSKMRTDCLSDRFYNKKLQASRAVK